MFNLPTIETLRNLNNIERLEDDGIFHIMGFLKNNGLASGDNLFNFEDTIRSMNAILSYD